MVRHSLHIALVALVVTNLGKSAEADSGAPTPRELEKVDVKERQGDKLNVDARFFAENGKEVSLGELFDGKPVILTFNYSNCPMLCSVQLGGLVDSIALVKPDLGQAYDIITISLDPDEQQLRTKETKASYVERYERPGTESSWHFLRGSKASIDAVAESVGFGYTFLEGKQEYLHPAVLTLVSPDGTISSYMYGTMYDPDELLERLEKAGKGQLLESIERFIHACYLYIKPTGNAALVTKIMRATGFVFVLGLLVFLATYGRKRAARERI